MSLEQALRDNTAMVERLCSILGAVPFRAPDPVGKLEEKKPVAAEVTRAEPAAETKSTKVAPSEAIPNESSSPVSGAQSEPEPQTSSLTYDDVKRATNNLSAAKGKEITIAALARFGVKRATELTQDQWQEYCDYTAKCVAGLDPREAA